jgi:hypothetical protein
MPAKPPRNKQARKPRPRRSEVAQELIEEGIRMRECPGIYFERVRQAFGQLSQAQVTAAVMYYGCYPEEIRREVEANAALTPEVLEQRYPGLVRIVPRG